MIVQFGEVVFGRIEIHIIIEIPVCVGGQVIDPTHGDGAIDQVGAAEEEVGGVQGTQRSSAGNDRSILTGRVTDEGDDLVEDVVVKLLVADRLMARVHMPVEPAFRVDAVDRKDLHFTFIDWLTDGINEQEAFVFEVIGGGRRQQEKGKAVVAVGDNLHVFVEGWAVPALDFSSHAAKIERSWRTVQGLE